MREIARGSSRRNRIYGLVVVASVWAGGIAAAGATGIVVRVDGTAGNDAWDGSSWGTAKQTIQAGIDAAYGNGGGEVWVKRGDYPCERTTDTLPSTAFSKTGIVLRSGVSVYGGFAGDELSRGSVGNDPALSVIRQPSSFDYSLWDFHVIDVTGITSATLDGFTITGGRVTYNWGYSGIKSGGGIMVQSVDDSVVISNCLVVGNRAQESGGGVYLSNASPLIRDCEFLENESWSYVGTGGGGLAAFDSAPQIQHCRFILNQHFGDDYGRGGGLFAVDSFLQLDDCEFLRNQSPVGSALSLENSSVSLGRCLVAGNVADRIAAIDSWEESHLNLRKCAIIGNQSSETAGIVCDSNSTPGSFSAIDSVISGNDGAGTDSYPAVAYICSDRIEMINCRVTGNGGTYDTCIFRPTNECTLLNSVFSGNTGGEQSATVSFSGVRPGIRNTIFTRNSSYALAGDTGVIPVLEYNLFDSNSGGDFLMKNGPAYTGAEALNGLPDAIGNVSADPLFVMDGPDGVRGTWDEVTTDVLSVRLTDSEAGFVPGALAGRLINPDISQPLHALIVCNTATTVEIVGLPELLDSLRPGAVYAILDYHLRGGSPAIDAGGGTIEAAIDFDGDARGYDGDGLGRLFTGDGSDFDIGVDEYVGPAVIPDPSPTPRPTPIPPVLGPDSDGDGFRDGYEIEYGSDPYDAGDLPMNVDLNHDGRVDARDATVLYHNRIGAGSPDPRVLYDSLDFNGDGRVDALDALLLYRNRLTHQPLLPLQWPSNR